MDILYEMGQALKRAANTAPGYISKITKRLKSPLLDLHPELANRLHVFSSSSEGVGEQSYQSFLSNARYYQTGEWVHKAITVKADNIAALDVGVVDADGEILDNHPITVLLQNPNPETGAGELWREWVLDMDLGGEMGLEVVFGGSKAKPLELWARQPNIFYIRPGEGGARYKRVAEYSIEDNEGDPYKLQPEEFIHIKYTNPLSVWRGLAPINAVKSSVVINELTQAWTTLFFRNQARPDYAIVSPQGVTGSEKEEIIRDLMEQQGGTNAHKPLVLEDGIVDVKMLSFPPKDLEWLEQRKMVRDEIGALFGVPDEIMGFGKDTYENFDRAERVLWTLTLVPLIGIRDTKLTRWFRNYKMIKPNETIGTDLSEVSQLQEDLSGKFELAETMFDWGVPVQQINQYLSLGIDEYEGWDIPWIRTDRTTLERAVAPPTLATPVSLEINAVDARKTVVSGVLTEDKAVEFGSDEHRGIYEQQQEQAAPFVERLQRIAKRELQRQQTEVGQALRERSTLGRGKYKKELKKWGKAADDLPPVSEIFNVESEIRLWMDAIEGTIVDAVETIGQEELGLLLLETAFDLNAPGVSAGIEYALQTPSRIINENTYAGLVDLFTEAEELGEGIPDIMERLSAYFGDRKSDYQTERIARTTMTGAQNFATEEAWKQSEVVKSKTWLTSLDGRERDSHHDAHDQTVGLGQVFTVGNSMLMHPGDPTGEAGEIINCRCGMTANLKE